jgi:beta-glucosidase
MMSGVTGADETIIEQAMAKLDLETKVRLLSGQDFWTLPAIPEIGLDSLVMSDGPIGVRGVRWSPDRPSAALPSPTALAATWDPDLAHEAAALLAQECRAKGVHVLLAPTVNLHRSPLGGRHFECYSEDPVLSAGIGIGYLTGLQDNGVGACVKHYVANDSETERFTLDVRVSERALRELYLLPFEQAVEAGAWSVMAAYNGVNGATMTENRPLLVDVLKHEWAFDGPVISDWTAARSTVPTAVGGLDVVMPAAGDPWGADLVAAVHRGEVTEERIDDKVRRVLRLAARVGALAGVRPAPATATALQPDTVTRRVATRSFVLARDDGRILPLDHSATRRIAVLGALADDARIQGGGSAHVAPMHVVSPLAGITAAFPDAEVTYAVGADPRPKLAAATGVEWTPITAILRDAGGATLYEADLDAATVRWMGGPPEGVVADDLGEIALVATLTPFTTGRHTLAINGFGYFTLRVGDEEMFAGTLFHEGDDPATTFLSPVEKRFPVELTAGQPVDVALTLKVVEGMAGFVGFTLGHRPPRADDEALLSEAAAAATDADVAVVVVGTTEEVESEGFDRTTLALPGRQDELVARVAAANPRTVAVVNAGSPVLMPWVDDVAAVLLTWFPGQEAGAALADVLAGVAEPGGRLPTTWPRRAEDVPALSTTPVDHVLRYDEDVFVGYRGWKAEPLFPFGHGLGYTTWEYESLTVTDSAAVVAVRNTGDRAGREVVQVYVGPTAAAEGAPPRPERWLAGFAAVRAEPGEAATVRVPLPARAFQVWDGGWRTVPGTYRVEAARSVADRRLSGEISL